MTPSPSLRDVAAAAGLSVATVSRALRGHPSVREETRRRVETVAAELGYSANACISGVMSAFRRSQRAAFQGNLAFLRVSSGPPPGKGDAIFAAAHARATELGYSLEGYSMSEYEPGALRRVLTARGIRGLVLAPPLSHGKTHLRLKLDGFAAVALGWGLLRPALDMIRYDYYAMIRLALRQARRLGGEESDRVGMLWKADVNRRSDGVARAAFLANAPGSAGDVARRFFFEEDYTPAALARAVCASGVKTLIVGSWASVTPELLATVPPARIISYGFSAEVARLGVHGWIDPRPDLMGRWGAEQLIGKLARFESGPPVSPSVLLVPPSWHRM